MNNQSFQHFEDTLIYDGHYVTVYQTPLGSLVLRPTNKLFEEYEHPMSYLNDRNAVDWELWEVLEDWFCNSEYELVNSDQTGDLISSDCPIILKNCDRNDAGKIVNYSDKWYFAQYAVRDERIDLYQDALLHLDKA